MREKKQDGSSGSSEYQEYSGGSQRPPRRAGQGRPAVRHAAHGADPGPGGVGALAFRRPPKKGLAFARALGNLLYNLGFAGEYTLLGIWRVLRNVGLFAGQLLVWLLGSVGRWLAGLFSGLWRDLTAPLRRLRKRRRQLHRLRERARSREAGAPEGINIRGVRIQSAFQFLVQVFTFLLPVAAVAALVFTIYNVTGRQYALAVELNGKVLGHVADQSVVESAKSLLRDRISLAPNQNLSDWQLDTTYSIAQTNEVTPVQQLVNAILTNATDDPNDIIEATGLYINDKLYAVTTQGDELRAWLQHRLDSHNTLVEGGEPRFVHQVSCDAPEDGKLYFTSSVEDYDSLISKLERNVSEAVTVEADGVATLAEIAHANGITVDLLLRRNPVYAHADENDIPEVGATLLIQRAQPFLQVQTVVRQRSVEPIPFETVEMEDNEAAAGTRRPVQQGVNGEREVWDDLYYIDGELVDSERVDEMTVVLAEPVDEVVNVGTYLDGDIPSGDFGAYFFPVPGSTWSSRGVGYHRGMDINAPEGTEIFASNAGTVRTAGWHWSYGWYIEIVHPDEMVTLYGHCSALYVAEGDHVARGDLIAAVGSTGVSTGPHLHLEFQPGGSSLADPLLYVTPPEGYIMNWHPDPKYHSR